MNNKVNLENLDAVRRYWTKQLLQKHQQRHDPVSDHRPLRQLQGFQGILEGN